MMIGGGGDDEERPSYGRKEESEEMGPSLLGMGRKRAAKNIMRALEDGDVMALDKALAAHYNACAGDEE
jgi:hypothetical protein